MKKGTFPLIESKAADEELFVLKREILERLKLSAERMKAADDEPFALKRESLEKGQLSADRITGS